MPCIDRRALLATFTGSLTPSLAVADSGVVLNFDGADATWDLAPDSPAIWLLQQVGLAMRDEMLSRQFEEEFSKFRSTIDAAIGDRPLGYLVRVEVYADGAGAAVIPNGQLVYPVRAGREPLDALAEHIRVPQIMASRPSGLRNLSTYVWFRRLDGSIKGTAMPASGRESFERSALAEARRRNLLTDSVGAGPDGRLRIERAAFWADVARNRLHDIKSAERRRTIESLNNQLQQAETDFNRAYEAYGQIEKEIARRAEYSALLDKVEAVAGLVRFAAERGYIGSSGKQVSTPSIADSPSAIAEKAVQADRISQLQEMMRQTAPEVNARGQRLKSLEVEMRATYESETSVPAAPTVAVPSLP